MTAPMPKTQETMVLLSQGLADAVEMRRPLSAASQSAFDRSATCPHREIPYQKYLY